MLASRPTSLNKNRSLFEKVANKVKEIIADIKAAISMLGNADAEIRAVKDDAESLEKINAMFDSLLEKAGESYRAENENGQKNNTAEAVKLSKRKIEFSKIVDEIATMDDTTAKSLKEEMPYYVVSPNTPKKLIEECGCKNLPLIIRFDSLYLAEREDGIYDKKEYHYHGLGKDVLSGIYSKLSDPDLILSSPQSQKNRRLTVVFGDERIKTGQGLVSIEIDTIKDVGSKYEYNNIIITFFDLNKRYLKNIIEKRGNQVAYKKETLEQVNPQLHEWLSIVNTNVSSDNSIPEIKKSVKKNLGAQDSEYLTAVESGDTETAQRMVDEAAKAAGYDSPMLYHGTMDDKRCIFLTDNPKIASTYSGVEGKRELSKAYGKDIENMSLTKQFFFDTKLF